MLLGVALSAGVFAAPAGVVVRQYVDKDSGGWAYKRSDEAFVAALPDCHIQWNAVHNKTGERYLQLTRRCARDFAAQSALHRAVLRKIDQAWGLKSFGYIVWGAFCDEADMRWCQTVAQASLASDDFIDYWHNYPKSRFKNPNPIFVQLANDTRAYAELASVLEGLGVTVRLMNVEKVFSERYLASPLAGQLDISGHGKNPRVMYNVGMAFFVISEAPPADD